MHKSSSDYDSLQNIHSQIDFIALVMLILKNKKSKALIICHFFDYYTHVDLFENINQKALLDFAAIC